MGSWGAWGTCSATCGSGQRRRERPVVTPPQYSGAACDATEALESCDDGACPVDCVLGAWAPWSACTSTCGGGTQYRERPVATPPQNGGVLCDPTRQMRECNTATHCPIDCVVGLWGAWEPCTRTCGGGGQSQARPVTTPPQYNGAVCPSTCRSRSCNTAVHCPVDCALGGWGPWGSCTRTCGGGIQYQERPVTAHPQHNGAACPSTRQSQPCNPVACPPEDSCSDAVKNGNEIGVDCGGPCPPCVSCGPPAEAGYVFSCSSEVHLHGAGLCPASCAAGYIASGTPRATCSVGGSWIYHGSCTPVNCGPPSRPGWSFSCSSYNYSYDRGGCAASCATGYTNTGTPRGICLESGSWGYSGACNPVDCGAPFRIGYDFLTCPISTFSYGGGLYSASCAIGYVSSGTPGGR